MTARGASPEEVKTTADASQLLVRPISPQDKQALAEGFRRLSEESRYRRFLSPHLRLTDAELRYFTEVDHHDHEALVAIDPDSMRGVGVARFIRSRRDPAVAEFAIAVADDWQRLGVGTRLAGCLVSRAREEGISTLTATLLADNRLMLNLAAELGHVRSLDHGGGTIEVAIDLPPVGGEPLRELLRHLAAGAVSPLTAHRAAR